MRARGGAAARALRHQAAAVRRAVPPPPRLRAPAAPRLPPRRLPALRRAHHQTMLWRSRGDRLTSHF